MCQKGNLHSNQVLEDSFFGKYLVHTLKKSKLKKSSLKTLPVKIGDFQETICPNHRGGEGGGGGGVRFLAECLDIGQ